MQDNFLYFVRHAETKQDPDVPSQYWALSNVGRDQANALQFVPDFQVVQEIFTSNQKKAFTTAQPLAKHLNLPIRTTKDLEEVRAPTKFLTDEEFFDYKRQLFHQLEYSIENSESCYEALARFEQGIVEITENNPERILLIVSHGTILTLFFAKLQNFLDNGEKVYTKWKNLEFCVWGSINQGKVIKNIFTKSG
ncbi:MAG: histidine phosphatase family protein [Candidatus Hodarchaeales archaeon]|jgi:broad specificity phosphatase PhoE